MTLSTLTARLETATEADQAEVLEMARDIVKKHYPEMRAEYDGRRIKIAIDAFAMRQSEIDALKADVAELVECLRKAFADPDRLIGSIAAMDETAGLLAKHGEPK